MCRCWLFVCGLGVVPENSGCVGSGSYCVVFGRVWWAFVLASLAGFQCCGVFLPVWLVFSVCVLGRTGSHGCARLLVRLQALCGVVCGCFARGARLFCVFFFSFFVGVFGCVLR